MIQVQIASQLTATGVDGVRWVLVEGANHAGVAVVAPAAMLAAAQAVAAGTDGGRRKPLALSLSLALVKMLVMGLGMGLAIWVAHATLGPVRLPWWAPSGAETTPRDRLPARTVPRAAPASSPASAADPLVTAVLS